MRLATQQALMNAAWGLEFLWSHQESGPLGDTCFHLPPRPHPSTFRKAADAHLVPSLRLVLLKPTGIEIMREWL